VVGSRRASVIRARSLGNDAAANVQLAVAQAAHISLMPHINKSPLMTATPADNVMPPAVTIGDVSAASVRDKSTCGGVNLLTSTDNDIAKVTASQRVSYDAVS